MDFLQWSRQVSLFTFTHTLCPVLAVFSSTSLKVNEFNGFNDLCQTASVNNVDCWNRTLFTNNFMFIVWYCCYYFTLIFRFNSVAALPCRKARRQPSPSITSVGPIGLKRNKSDINMASKLGVTALYVTPHSGKWGVLCPPRTPQDRRHWWKR